MSNHSQRSDPEGSPKKSLVQEAEARLGRIWNELTFDEQVKLMAQGDGLDPIILTLRQLEAEQQRLEAENRSLRALKSHSPLCPDHRDKFSGKPCPACSMETAQSALATERQRRAQVEQALLGLRRNVLMPCWCEMAVGNPMVHDHSPQCIAAQKALEDCHV